jgi:beta-glucanase (GH16 family)
MGLKRRLDSDDIEAMPGRSLRWILCMSMLAGLAAVAPARSTAAPADKPTRARHVSKGRSTDRSGHRDRPGYKRSGRAHKKSAAFKAADTLRHLIWSEEFNGPAGSSPNPVNWNFDTGGSGWGNEELESYTSRPQNASLDGKGDLVITARTESYTDSAGIPRQYTSARLQTLHKFQFQYGLVEASIQVPTGQGLWPTFWLLGDECYSGSKSWPACGEIDAMEVLGSTSNTVHGTLHAPWPFAPKGIGGTAESPTTPLSGGFHVYGVEWAPERISFLLDGTVYETILRSQLPAGAAWPFDHPFFLLLNLAVGGNWPGLPSPSTQFPAHMSVDWVRVWQ